MADTHPADMLDIEDIIHTTTPPPFQAIAGPPHAEFIQGSSRYPLGPNALASEKLPLHPDDRSESIESVISQSEQLVRQATTIAELQQQRSYLVRQMDEERARWKVRHL
jgi:hypothetical protein